MENKKEGLIAAQEVLKEIVETQPYWEMTGALALTMKAMRTSHRKRI